MNRFSNTQYLFAASGLLVLLSGLFYSDSTWDIAIHDTYFIVGQTHIAIAVSILFMFFSFIYFSFAKANKPLYKAIGLIHFILTALPIIALKIINIAPQRHRAYQNMSEEMDNATKFYIMISVSILVCVIGQLLFISNIVATLLKKGSKK